MSRETTFSHDLHAVRDKAALGDILTKLCATLAADLQGKGYAAKTIGIKLRYDDFKVATRDITLQHHTVDAKSLRQAVGHCLKRVPLIKKLRLLGVRASSLEKLEKLHKLPENAAISHLETEKSVESIGLSAPKPIVSNEFTGQLF